MSTHSPSDNSKTVATRSTFLPYGRQTLDADDIDAVVEVLKSDWLTTGPAVSQFETEFSKITTASHSIAVGNGTEALHLAVASLGIGSGDEVIVSPMTFAASANCVLYVGATPVFADVEVDSLLLNPSTLVSKITPKTKAIVAVDYAGAPCDYEALSQIATSHGIALIADACHSLGGSYQSRPVGSLADISTFSFHPVKQITTGEGGMLTTNNSKLAERISLLRNHGITSTFRQRETKGSHFYEMEELGFNYRLSDIQCALGLSQLKKLPQFIERRRQIAKIYDLAIEQLDFVSPLNTGPKL